jgi:uncharacterized protein (DUF488 family)
VPGQIFSIGHGGRTLAGLVDDLRRHAIDYLIDVRSAPYSRYQPEFCRDPLRAELERQGLAYVYLGDALGGRPADPACYDEAGAVDYARCRARPAFQRGIDRLRVAHGKELRVCLMCAEAKPARCHRTRLVGAALAEHGLDVAHILADGALIPQSILVVGSQRELFDR